MKKVLYFMLLFVCMGAVCVNVSAQVSIGRNASPHEGAVLDLTNLANLGLKLPVMDMADNAGVLQVGNSTATTDEPAKGMLIYNSNDNALHGAGIYVWTGSSWYAVTVIADASLLQAYIDWAESLNESDFTPSTWSAVPPALAYALDVVRRIGRHDAGSREVNNAQSQLRQAIISLVYRPDKTQLQTIIDVAQRIVDAIDLYVPNTVVGFADALAAAIAIYEDPEVTAAQVAAAQTDLTNRILNARLRAVTG